MVEIVNAVTLEEAVDMLNVPPPAPSLYGPFVLRFQPAESRNYAEPLIQSWQQASSRFADVQTGFVENYLLHAPRCVSPSNMSEHGWQLPPDLSSEEAHPFELALTSAYLRAYVDEWINTGLNADGSESIGRRSLSRAGQAALAAWSYMEKAPISWAPSLEDSDFRIFIAEPISYSGPVSNFFEAQTIAATRLFVGVITSDWATRLCKCRSRSCGKYFALPKSRPHKVYKHGLFCSRSHSSLASATSCMRTLRIRAHSTLINAAAQKLVDLRVNSLEWANDRQLKITIAAHLSSVIARKQLGSYRQDVRFNWVTRHMLHIEEKRRELIDAAA